MILLIVDSPAECECAARVFNEHANALKQREVLIEHRQDIHMTACDIGTWHVLWSGYAAVIDLSSLSADALERCLCGSTHTTVH